jgi:phosphatidylglycerophosphatase A
MKRRLSLIFSSGCYIGMIPGAPGTYASIATSLLFYAVYRISYRIAPEFHVGVLCVITFLGTLASAETSRNSGNEDPQFVVIDEVAGQLLTFLFLPISLLNLVLGTALFRIFDIWKPFPIRKLEPLGNGVGIMADDLMAGIYANLILQLIHWTVYR